MNTIAETVVHCDECDLGCIRYRCPRCFQYGDEHDAWLERAAIYDGKTATFCCEHCKHSLEVRYDAGVLNVRCVVDTPETNKEA